MNRWVAMDKGWRTLLLKTALVDAFWLLLAFVVVAEFYFASLTGPVKISWSLAAGMALRDCFPWILLSPVVIVLAGQFRFDRKTWRRSLVVHLAASMLVVALYESVFTLLLPKPAGQMFGGAFAGPPSTNVSGGEFPLPPGAGLRPAAPGVSNAVAAATPLARFPAIAPPMAPRFFDLGNPWPSLWRRVAFRTQFAVPIYWCIVCVAWVLTHLQESRERERRALELEARLTQANLRALKMQLQPQLSVQHPQHHRLTDPRESQGGG